MAAASLHPFEAQRLDALRRLNLLDTQSEERFDHLVELASMLLDVPIVLVSLVDRDRQWFKARVGLAEQETPRESSFCAHAIVHDDGSLFVVEDASTDPRFADNPLVHSAPNIRFYAGRVLHDPSGLPVGTICAIDRRPRHLGETEQGALERIGWLVEQELARADAATLAGRVAAAEANKLLILETMSEGLVLQGGDGRIIEWNPAAERVLGMTGDQLAGRTSLDPRWSATRADGTPWPGDTHPAMVALRTGRPVVDQMMGVQHPDGQRVWLRVNSKPVLDEDGVAAHVLTAFADVTVEFVQQLERQSLEVALRRSEETARVSLDLLEQGVVMADGSGTVLRMNPAASSILGYGPDELSGLWRGDTWKTFDEHGAVLARADRPITIALATGSAVTGRVVGWRHRDGRRIMLRLSCIPDVDGGGRFIVAFTDITAEHLAQRILATTFETAPVGLALIDSHRSILRCNSTFSEQAGRPKSDLTGADVVSLIHVDDRSLARDVGAAIHDGIAAHEELEHRVTRPDGSAIWVKTHLAVIGDLDQPMAIAATFDVTRERMLRQELSRFGHLFRHANDVITVIDRNGAVLYASPSSARLLGYPDGYHHDNSILDVVHPDDLAVVTPHLQALIDGAPEAGPFTVRVNTSLGEVVYLECVAVNLLDEPDVGGIVVTARDATERVLLTRELAHQALHDVLTGLGNRKLLDETLRSALARVPRVGQAVGLLFIDLDGFKMVNDTLGHAAGDAVLVRVGECIRANIRAGDSAARVGGDEFVVVLESISSVSQVVEIAQRVRDAIVVSGMDSVGFGASVGLAVSTPGETPIALMHRADVSLYRAKASHDSTIDTSGLAHVRA